MRSAANRGAGPLSRAPETWRMSRGEDQGLATLLNASGETSFAAGRLPANLFAAHQDTGSSIPFHGRNTTRRGRTSFCCRAPAKRRVSPREPPIRAYAGLPLARTSTSGATTISLGTAMQLAWSVRTELQKPSGSASNRVVSPSSNSGREGAAAWFQVVGGRFVAKMPGQVGDLPHDTDRRCDERTESIPLLSSCLSSRSSEGVNEFKTTQAGMPVLLNLRVFARRDDFCHAACCI